jgi:rhamnosyltransferase
MRVLGHIHTFNEADVIDRSLAALRGQSVPVEGVLLVDNASTDGTLDREFPLDVTVVRFPDNRMTSDPIIEAMRFADARGYDWVWVLNGDTAPRPDCLATLLGFLASLPPADRDAVWLLAALPVDATTGEGVHGFRLSPRGLEQLHGAGSAPYECDAAIWSGSLYRVDAVRRVGLPRSDYRMDVAEIEYGHRGRCAGLRSFVVPAAVAEHNIGGPSVRPAPWRFGPLRLELVELAPFRCYYVARNVLHFWLYLYRDRTLVTVVYAFARVAKLTASFALRPRSRRRQLGACLRGAWDGLRGQLDFRPAV